MLIDPESLKYELRSNVVEVVFTKVDGSLRKMRATLSPAHVPAEDHTETVTQLLNEETEPKKVLAVWDIDAKGWRSFRLDSIVSIQQLHVS